MIRYRSDIDGLRSIAVISVILYHFGFVIFSGGYVGVDIFFVISGFLIGRNVIEQSLQSSFSVASFAERRIRRLYPALIVVLLITIVGSVLILLPGDLRDFGKSLAATTVNLSNVQFYRDAGYFDAGSVNKPLLHTWSLAVEEQFYIALPLLMRLITRFNISRRLTYIVLGSICGFSFVTSCIVVTINQPSAFFLFWGRIWELGVGVGISYLAQREFHSSSKFRSAISCLGICLIVGPILTYDDKTLFPGLAALLPVAGAALLLLSGAWGDGILTPLITARPIVFTGLISYSLYLWHWPTFVFLNYYYTGSIPDTIVYIAIIGIFILSALSWWLIEKPFRKGSHLSRKSVFSIFITSSSIIFTIGVVLWKLNGLPQRYTAEERQLAVAAGDFIQSQGVCDAGPITLLPGLHVCQIGRQDIPPSFLVWGDSHARALRDGMDDAANQAGAAGLLVWQGGCPPLVGVRKVEKSIVDDEACYDATKKMLSWLRLNSSIKKVILVGRWSYYSEGTGLGADRLNKIKITDSRGVLSNSHKVFRESLIRTVNLLISENRRVFVLDPIPEIANFNARKLAQVVLTGRESLDRALSTSAYWPYSDVVTRQSYVLTIIGELEHQEKLTRISITPYFCKKRMCSAWIAGRVSYFDNNHLTVETSKKLADRFIPVFR